MRCATETASRNTRDTSKSAVRRARLRWHRQPSRPREGKGVGEMNGQSLALKPNPDASKERQRGVSGLDAAPSNLNTGSSRGVSGCTSNLFSQRAADDLDGSKPAGSESEPVTRGCQLEATNRVGTIANSPDLKF
jgi:hypothetical protein